MHFFLNDPALKPKNKADRNLKHKALTEFELIDNRIHRKANSVHKTPRYYVSKNEGFDYIVWEHIRLEHLGRDKT
jgi:hypothetical protein